MSAPQGVVSAPQGVISAPPTKLTGAARVGPTLQAGERLTITHFEAGNPWLTGYVDSDPTRQGMFSETYIRMVDPAQSQLITLLRLQR